MTDLENLQKQENQMEDAAHKRECEIIDQITELFMQLSPSAQADVLEALEDDEDNRDGEDDDE